MTDQERNKVPSRIADSVLRAMGYDVSLDVATSIIDDAIALLLKDYYIVNKEKVKELYARTCDRNIEFPIQRTMREYHFALFGSHVRPAEA